MTFMTVDVARAEMSYRQDAIRRSRQGGRNAAMTSESTAARPGGARHRFAVLHLRHA